MDYKPDYSEFSDPRLVAIYDTVNPIESYQAFYLTLAKRLSASTIIDLGCGSGLLTCELAKQGHHMIGVEPSVLLDGWPTSTARKKLHDPVAGDIEWWGEILEKKGNKVRYEIHYLFANSGAEVVSRNELIFRTQEEISQTLADAGFVVKEVYGDWDSSPATATSPEMIFVAGSV
ncbi:MAG: type 11 methyltransferase [Parcubacteria group bacterium Gr01-1014_56]|nr:MAG: type 11 methyltransferase [Parcubacteria group bacterium Gr01-1014_56]